MIIYDFITEKIYKIVQRFEHVSVAVDGSGNVTTFLNSWLDLTTQQQLEQEAYWASVEQEFGAGGAWDSQVRPARRTYY